MDTAADAAFETALQALDEAQAAVDRAQADPDAYTESQLTELERDLQAKFDEVARRDRKARDAEARRRARVQHVPMADGSQRISVRGVNEPDMYLQGGRSFFADLYAAQLKDDPQARARIDRHMAYEVEKRAVASATLGGIIPPQYLVDMYAKASRLGRVFADQVNAQELPDVGMSVIVPRITVGLAAAIQATESSVVATQDPTETDLTVPVRTIAGYSPVSRQALERSGGYSDAVLFEDMVARYWAALDVQALNGSGASGQMLGLLQTAGIASVAVSTVTAAGVYPKVADLLQTISTSMGGIGYLPDKLLMHPRRWAFFCAALDSQSRPFIVPEANGGVAMNSLGLGNPAGYGGPVGRLMGLPVFVDGNIPTTLGAGTNEDRIIITCSPIVHLWERLGDPVTLAFEQQAATSLQVQLVVYGYAAFTAGRYPPASGVLTGLTPPSF